MVSGDTPPDVRAPTRPRRAKPQHAPYPPPDALVAILKNQRDLERARDEGWYRVPIATAPAALVDGSVQTLAFYLPKGLGAGAFHVTYTAPVLGLSTRPRRDLLPDEPRHARADQPYLRVALGPLCRLARPIPSRSLRRVVFIATTRAKLKCAREINDLFHDSPLEDRVYAAFQAAHIVAERQYFVPGDDQGRYALDFAIFGQQRNLDVECDGDRWHANPARAKGDNRRNNYLTARGWSVMRFSTAEIEDELPRVLNVVRAALRDCGGVAPDAPGASTAESALLWQPALWAPEVATGQTVDPRIPARKQRRRRSQAAPSDPRRQRRKKSGDTTTTTPILW